MTLLALFALSGCLTVTPSSDRITAADLVPAWPEMGGVAAETLVGYAPQPGVRRVLRGADIQRIATQFHLAAPPINEVCFQRPSAELSPDRLLESMQRTLPGARISILDYSRVPVPEGNIEFPLTGLRRGTSEAFWRGYVVYAGDRRFPIWAKVNATVTAVRIVAAEDLRAGTLVGPTNVQLVEDHEFPEEGFAASLDAVAGSTLRRAVRAGEALRMQWLDKPKDVMRGDTVQVDAQSGATHLQLEGQALTSGAAGEVITVLNPSTHRRFSARVEAKGKVSAGKRGL
jgi:flagella basal body P-ring formation protein FlgA